MTNSVFRYLKGLLEGLPCCVLFDKPGVHHVSIAYNKWAWRKDLSTELEAARELWTGPLPHSLSTYPHGEKVVKNITTTILVKFKARLNIGSARSDCGGSMRAGHHDTRRGEGSRFAAHSLYVTFCHERGKRVTERTFTESHRICTFLGLCSVHTRQVYFASVYCSVPK